MNDNNNTDNTNDNSSDHNRSHGNDHSIPVMSLGERLFKARDYTPIPLILLLLFFAQVTVVSAVLGLVLVFFGELIRIYSVAFIGSISRTRKNRTGGQLIQEGPFAFVRNPLYVGNFFITLGATVFGGQLTLVVLAVILFSFQYYHIVKYEESLLKQTFGDEYTAFCRDVPPWIPRKKLRLDNIDWPDTFSPALRSERNTLTSISVLIGLLTFLA